MTESGGCESGSGFGVGFVRGVLFCASSHFVFVASTVPRDRAAVVIRRTSRQSQNHPCHEQRNRGLHSCKVAQAVPPELDKPRTLKSSYFLIQGNRSAHAFCTHRYLGRTKRQPPRGRIQLGLDALRQDNLPHKMADRRACYARHADAFRLVFKACLDPRRLLLVRLIIKLSQYQPPICSRIPASRKCVNIPSMR